MIVSNSLLLLKKISFTQISLYFTRELVHIVSNILRIKYDKGKPSAQWLGGISYFFPPNPFLLLAHN